MADLRAMLAGAVEWQPSARQGSADDEWDMDVGEYRMNQSGIWHVMAGKDEQEIVRRLTSFPLRIIREEVLDDGAEEKRTFVIVALIRGRRQEARVPADRLNGLNFLLSAFGAGAIVAPGQGVRDRVVHALLTMAAPLSRTIVTHAGWRQSGSEWRYYHGAGALAGYGPVADVDADLDSVGLGRYRLRHVRPAEGAEALRRATAGFRALAPDRITLPLFATLWLSLVGGGPFVTFLVGGSGTRKSAIASVLQQFWGPENHRLAGFNATRNGVERILHAGKDAIVVLDDAAPDGADQDIARLLGLVEAIVRSVTNRQARRKMAMDGTMQAERPARGQVVMTGEFLPKGYSILARLVVLEFAPQDVRLPALSRAQEAAGRGEFADALASVIMWMAARYDQVQAAFRADLDRYLAELRQEETAAHGRTTDAAAYMLAALSAVFCPAALDLGAISKADAATLLSDTRQVLQETREAQAIEQAEEHLAVRFSRLLRSGFTRGVAVLGSQTAPDSYPAYPTDDPSVWGWKRNAGSWVYVGALIGWVGKDGGEDVVYLDPAATYAFLIGEAQRQGRPLGLGPRQLWKLLDEAGALWRTEAGRRTLKVSISSRKVNCLALHANTILDDDALADRFPIKNGNRERTGTENSNDGKGLPDGSVVPVSRDRVPGSFFALAQAFFDAVLEIASSQGWEEFTGDDMAGAIKAAGPRDWWPRHQHLTARTFSDLCRSHAPAAAPIETHQRWRSGANVKVYKRVAFEQARAVIIGAAAFQNPSGSPNPAGDPLGDPLEYAEKQPNQYQGRTNPSVSPSGSLRTSLENGSTTAGSARTPDDDLPYEGEV